MVLEAARDLGLDLEQSWLVGDKSADIECGQRARVRTILVLTGYGAEQPCRPDFTVANAVQAAALILERAGN
jgi:D-glycero-D-manno-heptose 1,7-bisphosphate phosphatase